MQLLPLFIIIPVLASLITAIIARQNNKIADFICFLAGISLWGLSVYLLIVFKNQALLVFAQSRWGWSEGVLLVADGLSIVLLSMVYFLFMSMFIYNFRFLKAAEQRWGYHVIVLLLLTGINGVLIAADIFTMYVFLEVAVIASYALVIFRNKTRAFLSFFKYMVTGIFASALILMAIAVCYSYVATLNMAEISRQISIRAVNSNLLSENPVVCFMGILFALGIGLKTGLIPFLSSISNIQVQTKTPATNILSVLFLPVIGIYLFLRIFFNVLMLGTEFSNFIIFWAVMLIFTGIIRAMFKNNFKEVLACVYITEIGICLLAIGIGNLLTITAGLMHLFHYMINRAVLNSYAGIFEYTQGTTDFILIKGFKVKMPVIAITSLIGSFSFVGIPPFSGFWTKAAIVAGAEQAGFQWALPFMVIVSLGSFIIFFKVQSRIFFNFNKNNEKLPSRQGIPLLMKTAMVILAFVSLLINVLWLIPEEEMFLTPIAKTIKNSKDYASRIMDIF
ncbi:MAG: proton-conducting transporter membrane subunit [Candidatus Omnitrophota bacterium]